MPTKADLDAAIATIKQDVADAAKRAQDATAALQAKLDAGEDFSQEIADLNAAHTAIQGIATSPTPPASTTTSP